MREEFNHAFNPAPSIRSKVLGLQTFQTALQTRLVDTIRRNTNTSTLFQPEDMVVGWTGAAILVTTKRIYTIRGATRIVARVFVHGYNKYMEEEQ